MAVHAYTHELAVLADDLDGEANDIADKVARVTHRYAEKIQTFAQRRVRGHAHLPHLPRSFTYDVDKRPNEVSAEIGAEVGMLQGKLDVYIEYGTPTSNGIRHWLPASDLYVPHWVDDIEDAAEVFG